MFAKIAPAIPAPAGAIVINGKRRVLTPGLTDAHWHSMFYFWPISRVMNADFGLHSIAASKAAQKTLMRGFTTVRDAGATRSRSRRPRIPD